MAGKFVERSHGLVLILNFKLLLCFELLTKNAWIVGYILLVLAFLLINNFPYTLYFPSSIFWFIVFKQDKTYEYRSNLFSFESKHI